ncbi:sulfotransferase [Colwelliaceae bacterium 6471]
MIQQGRLSQALTQCQQYCAEHPDNLQAWYMLTDLYLRTKQSIQALTAVLKTEILAPEQPQVQLLKINCLIHTGNNEHALQTANELFEKSINLLAKDWLTLGLQFHQLNSLLCAHRCFKQAVDLEPKNNQYLFNYATSLRNTGELTQAEHVFAQVLALNPKDWDAYLARSLLKKMSTDSNNIAELKALIATNNSKDAQSKLLFALAKEQEDCQEYSESFKQLKQANDIRKEFTQYDVDNDIEAFNCITTTYKTGHHSVTTKSTDISDTQAIFIVGLPRTGTTLLERIISQDNEVFAAGELHDFSSCLTLAVTKHSKVPLTNKLDLIAHSASIDFDQLGKDYLQSTKALTKNSAKFIDKMPLNFLYTGLIQRALPNAKIIHLTRSPMAACYAIYKTSFGQAYPFSYDLNNLAKYYLAYRKLMTHWQQANANNFIEINYEQLVTSPAKVSKQAFNFLDIEWRDDYLQLQNNKHASATASSAQVRGEIYQSSVELWRHYQEELSPLSIQLEQAGIDPETW